MSDITTIDLLALNGRGTIDLMTTTLDCSRLFAVEETTIDGNASTPKFKLLHQKSGVLSLQILDSIRIPKDVVEYFDFLPQRIYIREEMQTVFNKLVRAVEKKRKGKHTVVFGSPGIGKSVLSFLAVLCYVFFGQEGDLPVLYLRKTTKKNEKISVFYITKRNDGNLSIEFDRYVKWENKLADVHDAMCSHIFRGARTKSKIHLAYLWTICDGPRYGSDDHVHGTDLVTSSGFRQPNDEGMGDIDPLPLSVWTQKEAILACRYLFKASAAATKEAFDICGGNIRRFARVFGGEQTLDEVKEEMKLIVDNDASVQKLDLALNSTLSSGSDHSIDRLRAMIASPGRLPGSYVTIQYIGSPFLLRYVRSKVTLKETQKALKYAKDSNNQSIFGGHFELLGHKMVGHLHGLHKRADETGGMMSRPTKCSKFELVEGVGTGAESVEQLTQPGLYWTPSTSNFANIDAAIAWEETLYCIQYTVSSSHTFNCNTFVATFWDQLPQTLRDPIKKIVIDFVVPEGAQFQSVVIPASQKGKQKIMSEDNISVKYRNARRAASDEDSDDALMEESEAEAEVDDMTEDVEMLLEESFSDDDCGEEGFGSDDEEVSLDDDFPIIHFQWETLNGDDSVDPLNVSLKFLN
mmetsp:Transcript_3734/g.8983  ORF Transcript_3734/g.8983 Transcript_3734/m.8983 type:complete len:635 (-) Transcript_3734:340-2244(-)|eukprot:CAMPEP_0113500758 /NCGR_PEP_ID=MMETSP0014_2-20120614/32530_1 /TAXON_ID=2857 /ORGANISM="Nitzschia sp." /LENGTH=634 /DNA_ID=CAMNT_0000395177 /DNA_START=166 /DNA_END=2070 /DNA_ORIENTATION=- /assembly_acc=CAM_ASM_000159